MWLLEEVAERRIDILRVIQAVSLLLTVIIVVVTMALVLRRVIQPLKGAPELRRHRARRGDFSGRTKSAGNDELGRPGAALNLQQRVRESRRLVLHEERSIIARELHDSLAQSLSCLKIQVTRFSAALNDPNDRQAPNLVLGELREGINSAYRYLRELLTTFRLKMDDRGLHRALEATVQEFRVRSAADIGLDNGLLATLLTIDDHPSFRKGVADLIGMEPALHLVGEAADGERAASTPTSSFWI